METEIPTLEEVKEYFKNAKEIKSCYGKKFKGLNNIHLFLDKEWFCFDYNGKEYCIYRIGKYAEIVSYKEEQIDGGSCINDFKTPKHYDNSKGSIYQFCKNQNLNSYEFDIIKRVVRSRKKGNFKEDLEKTKHLIDLYLKEYEQGT